METKFTQPKISAQWKFFSDLNCGVCFTTESCGTATPYMKARKDTGEISAVDLETGEINHFNSATICYLINEKFEWTFRLRDE
jgi:hypothetical protein